MRALIGLMLSLACGSAMAVACNSASTGTWNAAARWSCGHIPLAADDVTILNTHVVDITTANGVAQSLTVNSGGTMRFNSTTARTLTVSRAGSGSGTGNVTVNLGGTFTIANVTQSGHILRLDGNLTNNGTFNMAIDGNSRAIVDFNRNGAQTLTGTGATTNFQRIRLDMTSINNILDVTALSNLTFVNPTNPVVSTTSAGTFRISSPLTLSNLVNNTLPANLRLWVNNAGATLNNPATLTVAASGILQVDAGAFNSGVNLTLNGTVQVNGGAATVTGNITAAGALEANGGTLTVNGGTGVTLNAGGTMLVTAGTTTVGDEIIIAGGSLQIDNGTVNVGNAANETVNLQNVAGASFAMNGGALNIAGRFTSNNATGGDSFAMTNGTITVGTVGNTTNSAQGAPFYIGSATVFNMSGGTIVIQADNAGAAAREYDVNAVTSTVSGGTVQIGNATTAAGEVFQINSVAPVPNFTINAANAPAVTLIAPLSVAGNWTNDSAGTFTPGANTVTLSGSVAQTIGGTVSTTFDDLTIANTSGGVSLTASQTVSGTLTLTSGTFAVGANTLTLNGPAIAGTPANLSTTSSSNLSFGGSSGGVNLPSSVVNLNNLTLDNVNGLTLNGSPALAGTPGLTLTNGVVFTGTDVLTASASCPGSVTRTSGYVSGNLRITFPAGTPDCTFHLGDATNYTPMRLNFSAIATPGSLTASVTSEDHRNTTAGTSGIDAAKSVNRYWSLKKSTVAGTYAPSWTYVAGDNDAATPANYRIRRGASCSGSLESRTCTPWSSLSVSGTPTNVNAAATGVAITADDPAEADFAIGEPDASTNFLREKQFIYTRELY